MLQVFLLPQWPHFYSIPVLGLFPLHLITHIGVSPSRGLMLFGCEIILKEFQPMWSWYLNVMDGQTDRQTYCGISALCVASHGNNVKCNWCVCVYVHCAVLLRQLTWKWSRWLGEWVTLSFAVCDEVNDDIMSGLVGTYTRLLLHLHKYPVSEICRTQQA